MGKIEQLKTEIFAIKLEVNSNYSLHAHDINKIIDYRNSLKKQLKIEIQRKSRIEKLKRILK